MFDGHLECAACGREAAAGPGTSVCPECGRPLLARYVHPAGEGRGLAERWASRRGGMWRFRELLPLGRGEDPVTLQEGNTPLIRLPGLERELGGLRLYAKDEGRNPTGSFKDRGLSAAVTRAAREGASSLVIPSAGNAGAALSAYGARAGLSVRVYLPADTPPGVRRRCDHFGAEVVEVDGLIDECGRRAAAYARESGAVDVSTLREPYRLEGKKTMMLEIAEYLAWRAPDAVVYPTGGGTGLIATWKVLGELSELGLLEPRTRLYVVQSEGCAPIVRAWRESREEAEPWEEARTEAYGLRVPGALGDFLILRALRESGGEALAVPDSDMRRGAKALGDRDGLNASIEGGATAAAARRLREEDALRDGETVVLFNTGSVLTY